MTPIEDRLDGAGYERAQVHLTDLDEKGRRRRPGLPSGVGPASLERAS
jgi:hypothetical protein